MTTAMRAYVAVSTLAFAVALFLARWDTAVRRDPERALSSDQHRMVTRGLILSCLNLFVAAVVLVSQLSS